MNLRPPTGGRMTARMRLLVLFALLCSLFPALARPICTCTFLTTRPAVNYGRVALVREFYREDGSLEFSEQVDAFSWGEDTIASNAQIRHLVGFYPTQEAAALRCERERATRLNAGRCL